MALLFIPGFLSLQSYPQTPATLGLTSAMRVRAINLQSANLLHRRTFKHVTSLVQNTPPDGTKHAVSRVS